MSRPPRSSAYPAAAYLPTVDVDNFSSVEPGDFLAIVLLEERIIPWQNGQHAQAPARPIRSRATTYPLFAAEKNLRGSTRAGTPGVGGESGPGTPAEFARQNRYLLRWAERRARLIDRQLEARLENIGGVEHEVFFDEESRRWIKLTMPGKSGKELHTIEEVRGVRPSLTTGDALPSSYLRRLVLANRRLGDDFWLHGVMPHPGGPRLVVSQRDLDGRRAMPEEIAWHFAAAGFSQINAKTFYHPGEGLLVSDAHTANVFRTESGIAPFDVCVQQPRGALLRAVELPPTLDFGEDEEGSSLDL